MKILFSSIFLSTALMAAQPDVLPGTARWNFPVDIAGEQYAELEAWLNGEIRGVLDSRQPFADPPAARKELRRRSARSIRFCLAR